MAMLCGQAANAAELTVTNVAKVGGRRRAVRCKLLNNSWMLAQM